MYVTSWILHRVGQPWWTPSESKSVRLRTVSHRTHVISGSPPRNRYSDTDFMSLLRFRGAVVRDFLRPPGGDPVLGAALSGRHRRELVSQRRRRRLWRSAAGLAGRHERKGTGEETFTTTTTPVTATTTSSCTSTSPSTSTTKACSSLTSTNPSSGTSTSTSTSTDRVYYYYYYFSSLYVMFCLSGDL